MTSVVSLHELLTARRSVRDFAATPLRHAELVTLARAAQGDTGDGHRTTPSAHGVYPLSVTAVVSRVDDLARGIHRWSVAESAFSLLQRGNFADAVADAGIDEQPWLAEAPALLVLGADLATATEEFADQPPRGERGIRYVWLEAGVAAQNVYLAATEAGLGTVLVAGFQDAKLAAVHADLLPAGHTPLAVLPVGLPARAAEV